MSPASDGLPAAMPRHRYTHLPVDVRAVAAVLGTVRRLLRKMENGPATRSGWDYRLAALAAVVWPEGLDRRHLADLPLARRTRNCLYHAGLLSGTAAFTTADLLLPNFGAHTFEDLLTGIERFLAALADDPAAYVPVAMDPELLEIARRTGTGQRGPAERARLAAGLGGALAILRSRLSAVVAALSAGQRRAVGYRLLEEPQPTFRDIGRRLGVTGSRAQQLCAAVERRVGAAVDPEAAFAAAMFKGKLGHVVDENALRRRLDTAAGLGGGVADGLLRNALLERMDYVLAGGAYLDDEANALVGTVRARAHARADDAGLVDEIELLAVLPDRDWYRHWQVLRSHAGLHVVHGRLAIRQDGAARVKAALLSLGRPAAGDAIAAVCGLTRAHTDARLAKLSGVVRGTGGRWGLEAWVGGDFESIPGEIVRRIGEDGGATAHERLLAELPARFGVHVHSVRACLRGPRFVVRDGRVGLTDERSASPAGGAP